MTIESILYFLEQKTEELIWAEYNHNADWADGYQHALLQLRKFISTNAGSNAEVQVHTTIDLLNDAPFLEAIRRAINVCAAAEAVLSRLPKDDAEALSDAASHFRQWFTGEGT